MAFQLAQAYVELSARGLNTVTGGISKVRAGLGSLVSYAAGPVAMGLGALGLGAGAAGMLKMAADAEQLQIAFGTMLGSADKAKKMIADLNQFAAKTPFSMPGITQAARSLMAFGMAEDQVIPLLKVLGDVSAGTGKDLSELAVIFGQISATGRLTGGDLMQLTNAGVPMLKTLADQLGVTTGKVKEMVEGGEISSGMVTKAFQAMSSEGGLFAGMMEKQSGSLAGLWSTLTDTIGQGAVAMGQALVDGFDLKTVVANFTGFVEKFRGEWMPSIVSSVQWVSDNMIKPFFSVIGSMATAVFDFARDFDLYWEYAYTSVGNWMNNIYQVVTTGMSNAWSITKWFFSNFFGIARNVFMGLPKLFMNYIQLIINQWKAVLNFFKTGKIEIDWSPLQEAAKLIFKDIEMPKLKTAQTDALRGDLDNIEKRLAQRQDDRKKKQQEAIADGKKGNDQQAGTLKIEEGITKEKKKQKAEFSGLAELADKMQQAVFEEGKKNKDKGKGGAGDLAAGAGSMLAAGAGASMAAGAAAGAAGGLSQLLAVNQSLLAFMQSGSLTVNQKDAGGIKLPAASVKFGATG